MLVGMGMLGEAVVEEGILAYHGLLAFEVPAIAGLIVTVPQGYLGYEGLRWGLTQFDVLIPGPPEGMPLPF